MEISFIRHGRSLHIENNPVSCRDFEEWVKSYDAKSVYTEINYPEETLKKISSANKIFTSDLKRAKESARILNEKVLATSNALFREVELPIPKKAICLGVKLKPSIWAIIFRSLWFTGYASKYESLSEARERAKKAALFLIKQAEEHQSVVLVGHGFFNMFVAKELQKKGWAGQRKTSSKHWNCTTYTL